MTTEQRAAAVIASGFLLVVSAAAFVHPALALALLGCGLMALGYGRV